MQVGAGRLPAVAHAPQQCAAPNHLALVDGKACLLQVGVVGEFAVGVANGDSVAQEAARVIAEDARVRGNAGRHVGHVELHKCHLATCGGVDRLIPARVIFKRAAAVAKEAVVGTQLHEIEREGLAKTLLFVQVTPVARLYGPPCAVQREVDVGLLLVVGNGNLQAGLHVIARRGARNREDLDKAKQVVCVEREVERAQGQAGASGDVEIGLAAVMQHDGVGPALLEEQLVLTVAAENEAGQLQVAAAGSHAQVEGDFLLRAHVGEGQRVIDGSVKPLRAALEKEVCATCFQGCGGKVLQVGMVTHD